MDPLTYHVECTKRDKIPNMCVRHALELLESALLEANTEYLAIVDGTGGVVRTGDLEDHESDRMVKLSKRLGSLDTAISKVKDALGEF